MTAKVRHRSKQPSTNALTTVSPVRDRNQPSPRIIDMSEEQRQQNRNGTVHNSLMLSQSYDRSESIDNASQESLSNERAGQETLYKRWIHELATNPNIHDEILNGKRIALYRIRTTIGKGNFSSVKLAIHSLTKDEVAIKTLDKTKLDAKTQALLSREVANMERLHHPNVIRLYEVQETMTKVHIVMEYAPDGDLHNRIITAGRLTEQYAKLVFSQLVAAIDHLHQRRVIHRDLKAENVFFASKTLIKLGDFGFSTVASEENQLTTFCGSPPYAAPELFRDDFYSGPNVDVWALGILLYFMTTGVMPFRADTVGRLRRLILAGEFMIPPFLSDKCQKLLRSILVTSPNIRIPLAGILHCDWLKDEHFPRPYPPFQLDARLAGKPIARRRRSSLAATTGLKSAQKDSQKAAPLASIELRTLQELDKLGIDQDLIMTSEDESARGHVTGTYRVVLHRLQKESADEDSLRGSFKSFEIECESTPSLRHSATYNGTTSPPVNTNNRTKRTQSLTLAPKQKDSKVCNIL